MTKAKNTPKPYKLVAEARLAAAVKALRKIEGGRVPGASEMVDAGNWSQLVVELQAIARAAIAKAEGRS